MGIPVKLEAFEGPLDLLLHLIEKNKIDIYDIPIVEITEQYMEYIRQMQAQDMEVMSEFLVMAATLLRIKSKMLLPAEPKDENVSEDPREELVERLLEHKMYKYMAMELKDRQLDASKAIFKGTTLPKDMVYEEPPVDLDALVGDMDFQKLHEIFLDVLKRQEDKIDPIRSRYGRIEQEEVSLSDRIEYILGYGEKYSRFRFRELLSKGQSKNYVIVSFLAILELMKGGVIQISQEKIFGDIEIEMTGQGTVPDEISFEGA